MKIRQHPRLHGVMVGDEVYYVPQRLYAPVTEVFPAAVCVKIAVLSLGKSLEMRLDPRLWRADDIENLSVCRYCGSRENVEVEQGTGVPFRICGRCRSERALSDDE